MQQRNPTEIKEKILAIIKERGPSLPVQIAGGIQLSPLFTSAFLAELFQEKKIKMTYMRVGSSPVYYLDGQEEGLEKYSQYLKSKEKEAYESIRKNKFLKDFEQEPAIRVALRAIKDFAIPIKNSEIWRYYLEDEKNFQEEKIVEENTVKEELGENVSNQEGFFEKNKAVQERVVKEEVNKKEISETQKEFADELEEEILELNIKIIEKTQTKKKEVYWIGRFENQLGEVEVEIVGKDKKSVSDKDLEKVFEIVKDKKRSVVFFSTGELSKKAKEVYREYKNVLLFRKIN